jgi:hypothetical protein
MLTHKMRAAGYAVLLSALLGPGRSGATPPSAAQMSQTQASPALASPARPSPAQASKSRLEAALENIIALERPGQDGFATVWDGDKYVQCRRLADHSMRCEAASVLMQPSLAHVVTPDRVARLAALGWRLDPSFGEFAQIFPARLSVSEIADRVLQALAEGYDADVTNLEVRSDWIASEPCPPRNGPSQNLAGMINDAPSMAATAIHACAYTPEPGFELQASRSAAELIALYGARVTGEIQRLRVNGDRDVFVAFDTDAGYVQCQPQASPPAIYCEAQSADSWPVLASVLTPERVARLHAAGFADPGRAPNYSKAYPTDAFDDAAIAHELITLLHDVYGYAGAPKLAVATEKGDE